MLHRGLTWAYYGERNWLDQSKIASKISESNQVYFQPTLLEQVRDSHRLSVKHIGSNILQEITISWRVYTKWAFLLELLQEFVCLSLSTSTHFRLPGSKPQFHRDSQRVVMFPTTGWGNSAEIWTEWLELCVWNQWKPAALRTFYQPPQGPWWCPGAISQTLSSRQKERERES